MTVSAKQIIRDRIARNERLQREAADLSAGFRDMVQRYYAPGTLDTRQKELAAVACSVTTAAVSSLAIHCANALAAGATRQEIVEAAAIGVEFGGGPAFTLVRDHLLDFLDEIEAGI